MTKPVVTLRNTKGSALDYDELDANFTNLRDSTINFTDGTNTLSMDLNDTVTLQGDTEHNMVITVNEAGNVITVENQLGDYTQEPMGFENRTDSTISFNASTREFTIAPVSSSYRVWVKGVMFTKTTSQTVTLPNTTGLYYIYFDAEGDLDYEQDYFDFSSEAPISYVYFNSSIPSAPYFADERHGITLDWQTHEYLHRTRGAAYASGFALSNYTTSGTGSSDADAQLDIGNGTFFDEDIKVQITHSNTPTANTWEQDLQGPAQIPVVYRTNGAWELTGPSDYPLVTGVTRVTYNLNTAGVWSTPDASDTYFVSYWLVATNNLNYPIISIMGQAQWNKLSDAQENDTWDSLDLTGFPSLEFRPLYRLIFRTATAYANTPKAYLADVEDLRLTSVLGSVTVGAGGAGTVNDGAASMLAYYPANGTTVDDVANIKYSVNGTTGAQELRVDGSTTSTQLLLRAGGYGGSNEAIIQLAYAELLTLIPPTSNPGVLIQGTTLIVGNGSNSTITSSGNYDLTLKTGNTSSGSITIQDGLGGDIDITTYGSAGVQGDINLNASVVTVDNTIVFGGSGSVAGSSGNLTVNSQTGFASVTTSDATKSVRLISGNQKIVLGNNNNHTITTQAGGDLILNTAEGVNSGSITILDGANQNITIAANGTGLVRIGSDLDVQTGIIGTSTTDTDILIEPNGTGVIVATTEISSIVAHGTASLDTSATDASYANNATVDFPNFSGIIIVNNTGTTGQVMPVICGGGSVAVLGYSGTGTPHKTGTITTNPSINGYTWTNDSGATDTFSFATIRTRNTG